MKRNSTWAIMLLLGGLLAAGSVMAQEGGTPAEGRRALRMERLADRLDLSDEQSAKIDRVREEGRAAATELRKEMMRLRNEMDGAMLADEPDAAAIRRLANKIGEVRTQLDIHRLETRLAVRKVLTPEQRDQMILRQGRQHRPGWGGPGGPAMRGMGAGGGCQARPGAFHGKRHHPGAWCAPGERPTDGEDDNPPRRQRDGGRRGPRG